MKYSSLPVKRRTAKKGTFRTLFANVARKRHRAATAAAMPEIEGDVPSVGVARALVVILAIHIVAIAGIFIHSRFFEKPEETVAEKPKLLAPIAPKVPDDAARLPKIAPGDTPYPVGAGESYATIAAAHNVSEEDLRIANNNTELRSGKILRIPAPRRIVAQEPEAMTALRSAAQAPVEPVVTDPVREEAPMVETDAVAGNQPMLVRPQVTRGEAASSSPVSTEMTTRAAAPAMSGTYKVKAGDTLWRISQNHGTTPEALMKANGIKDASKLRVGMELKVPNR